MGEYIAVRVEDDETVESMFDLYPSHVSTIQFYLENEDVYNISIQGNDEVQTYGHIDDNLHTQHYEYQQPTGLFTCTLNDDADFTGFYSANERDVRSTGYGDRSSQYPFNAITEPSHTFHTMSSSRCIQHGNGLRSKMSKEEYEASVCLCGSQVCRGSYLNLTGEDAFQNYNANARYSKDCHGLLDRHKLMLEACEKNFVSQKDYIDLATKAGLGPCLLAGLPDWLITYSAHLVRFINLERTKLPEQILKHNLEEKRKFFTDICLEAEKNDAEVQAEGVYNQRLQNLALTLDKVEAEASITYLPIGQSGAQMSQNLAQDPRIHACGLSGR
ncbi:hypothetical protein Taro_028666 [Colocasia esculenta]|uniref:ATXR3 C-terminal domain-containing protein n=1 Tax=Colocasia esculenta TaxID=4460 RepID=A0A843VH06_COLES|nr:hypothetical protein [Colocasia esculenta]